MPRYEITAPDGKRYEINAPEGASEQDVMAYAQQHYGQPDAAPKQWTPKKRTPGDLQEAAMRYDRDNNPTMAGIPWYQQAAEGVGKSVADTALGVRQLVGAADQAEVSQRSKQDDALLRTGWGNVGDVGGIALQMAAPAGDAAKVLSGAGKFAPYLGAAVRSGVFQGTQPVQSGDTRLGNMAEAAAAGAVGQKVAGVAGAAAKKAAKAISPEVMRLYQAAKSAGIPVHFSQLADSKFAKTLASTLSYFPLSGAGVKAKAQQEGFNRAVSNTFYADAKTLSDDVMSTARKDLGAAYDKVFHGQTIQLDRKAIVDLFKLHNDAGTKLEASKASVARAQIERILDQFGSGKAVPAEVYQSLRSELRKDFPKGDAIGAQVANARKILDDAAGRQLGPARQKVLQKLNAAYANLRTTEDALKQVAGAAGNVRPSSLYPLIRNGSTKDMRELAKIGQVLLKDPIPDSGTAGRLLVSGALSGGAIGGGLPLIGLAKLMAVGATAGRAANSDLATRYAAVGNQRTLNGLARLAKAAPVAFPTTVAAKKKERPKP